MFVQFCVCKKKKKVLDKWSGDDKNALHLIFVFKEQLCVVVFSSRIQYYC